VGHSGETESVGNHRPLGLPVQVSLADFCCAARPQHFFGESEPGADARWALQTRLVFHSASQCQLGWPARRSLGAIARLDVLENSSNDIGFGHFANHAQLATTTNTHTDIDIENLLQPRQAPGRTRVRTAQ